MYPNQNNACRCVSTQCGTISRSSCNIVVRCRGAQIETDPKSVSSSYEEVGVFQMHQHIRLSTEINMKRPQSSRLFDSISIILKFKTNMVLHFELCIKRSFSCTLDSQRKTVLSYSKKCQKKELLFCDF